MSGPSSSRRTNESDLSKLGADTQDSSDDALTISESNTDSARVKHVQKEWEHRNFYIPEELDEVLKSVRAEMEDDLREEFGGQMAVTRHLYPVMMYLGLSQIRELSPVEFADYVDQIPGVQSDEFTNNHE